MMSRCLVRGCRNSSGRSDGSVTFHPLPAERVAAERWASLCGVSGQECSELLKDLEHGDAGRYQLCSLHFEQRDFETNPHDKTRGVKLRRGAEPTLLLSPAQTSENNAQVNPSLPATHSPQRSTPPPASSCPACSCDRAEPQTSAQVPVGGKSSNVQVSAAESGPGVSLRTPGATVVTPQPGVNQIVLNFREQGRGLTLDNVSTESAPQCRGGCHCLQRVVKQVVLIFVDPPRDSVPPASSQEAPRTLSSSTQTERRDEKSEPGAHVLPEDPVLHLSSPRQTAHQGAVHAGTQTELTTAYTEVSPRRKCERQDSSEAMETSPEIGEDSSRPGEQICSSTACEPDQQTTQNVTGGHDHVNDLPPENLQPPLESLDTELEDRCVEPTSTLDPGFQAQQLTDDPAPRHVGKCEQTPETLSQPPLCPHSQRTPRQYCLDPSINQYVGDLLEQHCVPPPPCVPSGVSPAQCPCISARRGVKQIVLNFVEPESAVENRDVPASCTTSDLSPPVTSQQHQETQTCDDFLPKAKEKPKSLQSPPPRPPKSHSCPPLLAARTTLSWSQEGERSPVRHPMDVTGSLENKVTFKDVAIYFSKEEWELLGGDEKDLYREVMSDNYQSLISLGLVREKPDLLLRIENEEENLWVDQGSHRRIRPRGEDLGRDMEGVRILAKDNDASPSTGRESVESSSHLGALMRLVNEIPGFLLGSSVTDGSCSPACSTEDHGSNKPFLEVKTEEQSPACSPAFVHGPPSETPEIAANLGVHRSIGQSNGKIVTKAEKAEGAVSQSSRYSTPVSHPPVSPSCMKSDPGASNERLQIKQEELPVACSPSHRLIPPVKPLISHLPKNPLYSPGTREHLTPEHARRPCSGGGSRSTAASPRNPSVSPASSSHGTTCTNVGELRIKIKQEDSGSERDLAESPVYGRRVYHTPGSSSTSLHTEREPWRMVASPRRSPADVPPGSSSLHRLVNCLKDITTSRPRPYSSTLSTARWGPDASVRANISSRESTIPAPLPNPFTVAVTNGAGQLRGAEPKTPDSQSTRASRDESPISNVSLSALGRCLEKLHPRGASHNSEETRRAELGVKRTHSDDLSCRPGAKRPALEGSRVVSSCSPGHRDLWRPPEELPRAPSEDQSIGNSHLMSVMNCVRKIPACRSGPSIHVTSPADTGRTCAQGAVTEMKDVKVKQEKDENPPLESSKQWIPPPQSPDVPKQSGGPLATNVHLTGLMRLMEEIPCSESSNPSRAMYSIAVGHSLARRMDRSNYLSSGNDDSSFPADLNDSTIASVDSVYSDDTSWSSENVDPSYSAIGGLQRVVSEFSELGSVSPLVAVAAPPVSGVQDGNGLKKPKEASPASAPRLTENVRRSPRDAAGIAASACSAENGEAAIAAIRGLQKVVRGFVEQECVSPITAVRNNTPNAGLRDCTGRRTCQEEEAASPHLQGLSPAPVSHFLCDTGKWLSEPDSSYSALSGLQKVVNGFSEMSCVSPFSAVSTPISEGAMELSVQRRSDAQGQDFVSSALTGQKNVINGVPDGGCLSPLTVASTVSSESDAGPTTRSRYETSQKCSTERQRPSVTAVPSYNDSEPSHGSSSAPAASSHCIDLTQEEEPVCSKRRTPAPDKERKPKTREGPPLGRSTELPSSRPENLVGNRTRIPGSRRIPCNQLIDLTEEEETPNRPKVSSSEASRKPSHTGMGLNPPLAEKHKLSVNFPKAPSVKLGKPQDPGASGSTRGAVPAVNEHLSGLEKLLKGVPTFTPANRPSGQAWSGSWWFKSTSSPET